MSGRHKKASHRGGSGRRYALPAVLVLGVVAAGAIVARGSGDSPGDAERTAAPNGASVLAEPEPAPTIAELPAVVSKAKPRPAKAKPKPKPKLQASPKPSPTRAERASRDAERTSASRCPVDDEARSHPNGKVPESHLCALPQDGHQLHGDAADAFRRLNDAYRDKFGEQMCVSSSYRTFDEQADLHRAKPVLAAKPGTSNHGWGLAVDLCDGPDKFGTPEYDWMRSNAGEFGFENPSWARQGGSKPEAWHWEYVGD
jgi:LAS superfamily LD-carboxypeptidase LdcB